MSTRMIATRNLLLLMIFALAACWGRGGSEMPAAQPPAPPPVQPYPAVTRIYYDNGGGIQDSLREVLTDADAFSRRWQQATSSQASPPSPPSIDFSMDMVVLVAAGRMTPDDQIRVDSATVSRAPDAAGVMTETLNVVVRTTVGCRRFNAPAHPLELVRLRRFNGPIRFLERRVQAEGCLPPDSPLSNERERHTRE